MKYNHTGNFSFEEAVNFEHPTGESLTVPDMTMSLQELVSRNIRGLPIPGHQPSYNDEFIPDIKHMDLTERDDYIDSVKQRNEAAKDGLLNRLNGKLKDRNSRKNASGGPLDSEPSPKEA